VFGVLVMPLFLPGITVVLVLSDCSQNTTQQKYAADAGNYQKPVHSPPCSHVFEMTTVWRFNGCRFIESETTAEWIGMTSLWKRNARGRKELSVGKYYFDRRPHNFDRWDDNIQARIGY
jgi:hypothetical protein